MILKVKEKIYIADAVVVFVMITYIGNTAGITMYTILLHGITQTHLCNREFSNTMN